MENIKIFGLPRTCTNVAEILIKTNFECKVYNNFPCWKHGPNTIKGRSIHEINEKGNKVDIDNLKFVICTKHPYNWLWSLWNFEKQKPHFRKRNLDQFLNDECCFHYRDENPIKVFNKLTHHWLTMQTDPKIIQQIKSEDMINKQEEVCQKLMNSLNLKKKKGKILHYRRGG
jgi:hypothetical protein